jgi:hypothetical protein
MDDEAGVEEAAYGRGGVADAPEQRVGDGGATDGHTEREVPVILVTRAQAIG